MNGREGEREIYIYGNGFGHLVGVRGCPVGLKLVRWSHVSVVVFFGRMFLGFVRLACVCVFFV